MANLKILLYPLLLQNHLIHQKFEILHLVNLVFVLHCLKTRIEGNDHLQVTVIASEFNGLSLVKQHKLIYSALKEELASEAIHALALKTETPN